MIQRIHTPPKAALLILPDRNVPRARFLMPVKSREWRSPSQAQPKDQLGNENCTRFRIRARLHDGHIVWTGRFQDRDDFDAFLWAIACGTLHYERELWDLPAPAWRPWVGEELSYEFATLVFLTTPTGSNQTYTSASDWNNSSNQIETLGSGGSGGCGNGGTNAGGCGGGGGAWNKTTNFTFATPGTTTATWQTGTAGTAIVNSVGNSNTVGNAGGDTWFNGTTLGGSTVGSKGGTGGGAYNTATTANGGTGGVGASGTGSSSNNGGRGGNTSNNGGAKATGGGGAAGSTGAGNNGGDVSANGSSAGGTGDAAAGGSAGTAADGSSPAGNGGNGAEWDASHGSGGGGGGCRNSSSSGTAGTAGNYGAGGGGTSANGTCTSGAGIQGIVMLSYTPGINMPWIDLPSQLRTRAEMVGY